MALRDKIAAQAQPHLQPGEQIQGVLFGQTASQFWILLGIVPYMILNRFRTIVATDRRIVVFDSGIWSGTKAKSVVAEMPRNHQLGPWNAGVWYRHQVGTGTLRIHRRFKKDIEAIDGVVGQPPAPSFPPPPPAPQA